MTSATHCWLIAPTPTGAATDTGTLVLYDETNAAAITLNSDQITINTFEPELLINNVTTPAINAINKTKIKILREKEMSNGLIKYCQLAISLLWS